MSHSVHALHAFMFDVCFRCSSAPVLFAAVRALGLWCGWSLPLLLAVVASGE